MKDVALALWSPEDAALEAVVEASIEAVVAVDVEEAPDAGAGALALAVLEERARTYERGSKAAATWRAYASDLRHFGAWCTAHGLAPLPAEAGTLRAYLVDHADDSVSAGTGRRLSVATLRRRLAAISEAHRAAGYAGAANPTQAPEVRLAWEGIRRAHGRAPAAKEAAVTEVVAALLAPLGSGPGASLIDVRDRALVLLGFAAALRRSELAALAVGDVVETGEGLRVHVRRSKTDQEGAGATVGVTYGANPATCPVRAWRAWVARAGIGHEPREPHGGGLPAFRGLRHGSVGDAGLSGGAIARIVQRRAGGAGLDPALFAAHSLRSGFATAAARAGVPEHKIMRQGRWRTAAAMRGYIHTGELFVDNPTAKLGL